MRLFNKKIPTSKEAQRIGDNVFRLSQELKNIIISHNCVDFSKINVDGLDYALYMYDLEFYRQVMSVKHSQFFIQVIIRTICSTFDTNIRNAGNIIRDNYFLDTYLNLSNSLRQVYNIAQQDNIDEFVGVSMYFCSNELQLTYNQIELHQKLVLDIADHFRSIINLPYNKI